MSKPWGEEFRTTTVCIDSYEGGVLAGHFYNPHINSHRFFSSTTQFLIEMEKMLDDMEFPKAFSLTRVFLPPPEPDPSPPGTVENSGLKATFAIRILFRQNSSWQGSITWIDGRREQSFRSVLELILLMDNALSAKKAS